MPTVYTTAPREAAADLASSVVEEGLAACVNVVRCESTFRWQGEVHEEPESILFAKTTTDAAPALMARLAALHPHDVPCIERFEESRVAGPFGEWRAEVVDGPA